jgi:hypothetical protein
LRSIFLSTSKVVSGLSHGMWFCLSLGRPRRDLIIMRGTRISAMATRTTTIRTTTTGFVVRGSQTPYPTF